MHRRGSSLPGGVFTSSLKISVAAATKQSPPRGKGPTVRDRQAPVDNHEYVEHCRLHGVSWSDIGTALGVTRQAAQQRFLAPHVKYEQSEFAEELRTAMARMKKAAVQHRNNYIGTEHVLWGLLAEDNTATRLLRHLGLSPGALRRDLEPRLTPGASQAAERIAWTPYARRALAAARDLARAEGLAEIGCDHLLAGLASLARGVAADVLGPLDVDGETVAAARDRKGENMGSRPGDG